MSGNGIIVRLHLLFMDNKVANSLPYWVEMVSGRTRTRFSEDFVICLRRVFPLRSSIAERLSILLAIELLNKIFCSRVGWTFYGISIYDMVAIFATQPSLEPP